MRLVVSDVKQRWSPDLLENKTAIGALILTCQFFFIRFVNGACSFIAVAEIGSLRPALVGDTAGWRIAGQNPAYHWAISQVFLSQLCSDNNEAKKQAAHYNHVKNVDILCPI